MTNSANLIDVEADELVARFEHATQLGAVERAQAWWREHREGTQHEVTLELKGSASLTASLELDVPRLHVPPDELAEVVRHKRVLMWTEPDPDDPESRWQATVYAEDGRIIDWGLGFEPDEARAKVREALLPPEPEA